ncbi:hypothetical protein LQZ18_10365 [Lachnospiraceae bacterium ZAX-1]
MANIYLKYTQQGIHTASRKVKGMFITYYSATSKDDGFHSLHLEGYGHDIRISLEKLSLDEAISNFDLIFAGKQDNYTFTVNEGNYQQIFDVLRI